MRAGSSNVSANEFLASRLGLVDDITAAICRRNCCYGEDAEDFASIVKLKLIDNDYAILRKFEGKAKLSTYLTTVILNMFRDYRIQKWGKWRPSAAATRLGEEARQLEILIYRDGFSTDEAVEMLRTNLRVEKSEAELLELAAQLPQKIKRRFKGEEVLQNLGTEDGVERRVVDEERVGAQERVRRALAAAVGELSAEDRLLLKLRFQDGLQVSQIARVTGREQRPLYTRFEKLRAKLRRSLEAAGVSWADVAELLEWEFADLAVDYAVVEDSAGKSGEASV